MGILRAQHGTGKRVLGDLELGTVLVTLDIAIKVLIVFACVAATHVDETDKLVGDTVQISVATVALNTWIA